MYPTNGKHALFFSTASCTGFLFLAKLTPLEAETLQTMVGFYNLPSSWTERNCDGHAWLLPYDLASDEFRNRFEDHAWPASMGEHEWEARTIKFFCEKVDDAEVYQTNFRGMALVLTQPVETPFNETPFIRQIYRVEDLDNE